MNKTIYIILLTSAFFSCATNSIRGKKNTTLIKIIDENYNVVEGVKLSSKVFDSNQIYQTDENGEVEIVLGSAYPITLQLIHNNNDYFDKNFTISSFLENETIQIESAKVALLGMVYNEDDIPISDCEIYTDPITDKTITNANGEFNLSSEKFKIDNEYNLTVTHRHYETQTITDIYVDKKDKIDIGFITLTLSEYGKAMGIDTIKINPILPGSGPIYDE